MRASPLPARGERVRVRGSIRTVCAYPPCSVSPRGWMLACLPSHKRLPLTPTLSPYGALARLRGEGVRLTLARRDDELL